MDREIQEFRTPTVDIDFDCEGHIIEGVATRSGHDPLLQAIVNRMIEGAQVSPEELRYYELVTAELRTATSKS